MITLCMDTSNKFLVVALIKDDKLIVSREVNSWKKQSEYIFPVLNECLDECGLKPTDIDEVVITKGPGSYTGVRIAMTVAKVLCSSAKLPLYTLSSLQLIASDKENTLVLMDARSKRAYYGLYNKGELVGHEGVDELINISSMIEDHPEVKLAGDASLFDQQDNYPNMAESFLLLKKFWNKVDNVDTLVPEYYKSSEDYLVKK